MNVASAYKMNQAPATYLPSIFMPVLYRFFPFSDIFPPIASGKRVIKDTGI